MAEICSLADAIARNMNDGETVAMEGFTIDSVRRCHEVIRQGRKRLRLVRMTPDLIYEPLDWHGVADRLVFSWGGNPGVGLCIVSRRRRNGWPNLWQ